MHVTVICCFEPMTMSREIYTDEQLKSPVNPDKGTSKVYSAVTHLLKQVQKTLWSDGIGGYSKDNEYTLFMLRAETGCFLYATMLNLDMRY
ncbi:hypothetical protein GMA19_01723 [Paenibacillus polymyxa E681]|nr:hypothetical protein PPE_01708 [Paenibacillus polymyxa E681]QNV56560.1 hypothetical protein GE561_01723 [Paenibacillus polymyxa E681]QNV61397.1 hypothetical protein GMA19_01723 [Paenibacillus polymyxa E681]